MKDFPSILYHYTTINSLAYILNNKSIRFTKLSNLNDPLEGKTEELRGLENLVFCSSWTANNEDTIPMWKMYSDLKGVRIKIASPKIFANTEDIVRGEYWPPSNKEHNRAKLNSELTINSKKLLNGHCYKIPITHICGPDPVIYLKKGETASRIIVKVNAASPKSFELFNLIDVGLYKSNQWCFEDEWRFRLVPLISNTRETTPQEFVNQIQFEKDYIDVDLNQDVLNNIEIMLGPLTVESDKIIVKALCKKYKIKLDITKSEINIINRNK